MIRDNFKSDYHVPENFCQIKIFPSHIRKNTAIYLFGKNEKKKNFKKVNFVFLKNRLTQKQTVPDCDVRITDNSKYVNSKIPFLLTI